MDDCGDNSDEDAATCGANTVALPEGHNTTARIQYKSYDKYIEFHMCSKHVCSHIDLHGLTPDGKLSYVTGHDCNKNSRLCALNFFCIIKFLATEEDKNEYIEVGLRAWLTGNIDDNMECSTYWPPSNAMPLIRAQSSLKTMWKTFKVKVLRFFDTFLQARQAVPKFCVDSQYETETEAACGKGLRKKFRSVRSISSSDDDDGVVRSNQSVPSPPRIISKRQHSSESSAPVSAPKHSSESSAPVSGPKPKKKRLVNKVLQREKDREETLAKLKDARRIAAVRMNKAPSPLMKGGMTSPWKVNNIEQADSSFHTASPKVKSPPQSIKSLENVRKTLFSPEDSEGSSLVMSVSHNVVNSDSEEYDPLNDNIVDIVESEDQDPTQKDIEDTERRHVQKSSLNTEQSSESDFSIFERLEILEKMVKRSDIILREISKKNDILVVNTTRILKSLNAGEKRLSAPPDMPQLPLRDKKQLNILESFLKSSSNKVAVVDYLSNFIVRNVSDPASKSVRSVLSNILANNVAELYNLDGGGSDGKEAFRKLKIYEIVKGLMVSSFEEISIPVLDSTIGLWLTNAKWREGGSGFSNRKKASSSAGGCTA